MLETILYAFFPYLAIAVCLAGSIYHTRFRDRIPSPWQEARSPVWRWIPWQHWLLVIIGGHLLAFLCPRLLRSIIYHPFLTITIEAVGITITVIGLIGLLTVLTQHMFTRRLIGIISAVDLLVILLLIVQLSFGLTIIIGYRWSASWSLSTTTPYLWSLITFHPDPSFITDMPFIVKGHIFTAWLFVLCVPFSNIRHIFALPFRSLEQRAYRSIWNEANNTNQVEDEARRHFLRGAGALTVGGAVVATGFVGKLLEYVFGLRLTSATESELLGTRLERLHATVEQKELEYERVKSEYILVAKYTDLSKTTGRYFIDYLMRPALAFIGPDGLPLLISAKCTHLGCTVGNQVTNGKILCPCHVTYFSVASGKPDPGSPAKEPLPHLGWVIKDSQGEVVASKTPDGKITGRWDPRRAQDCSVYIAKRHAEGRS